MNSLGTSGITNEVNSILKNNYPEVYAFDKVTEILIDEKFPPNIINIVRTKLYSYSKYITKEVEQQVRKRRGNPAEKILRAKKPSVNIVEQLTFHM